MAWKMIGDPKVRKLTRALAEEFAGMTPAPKDRPLNAVRAGVCRKIFELGRFRTAEWAKAYCEETKETYRVNGKHTSTVAAQINGAFPTNAHIVIEEFNCPTLEDVASLYATFDTRSAARTASDINMMYSSCCPELDKTPRADINLCVGGISYSTWEDGASARGAEERAQLIVENVEFCLWLSALLKSPGNDGNKQLRRASVVAAMYKSWHKSHSAASEFWAAVRDESGTKPEMADRKLGKFLLISRITKRDVVSKEVKRVGQRELYVKCAHAWNAWRKKESTNLNYHSTSKTPAFV